MDERLNPFERLRRGIARAAARLFGKGTMRDSDQLLRRRIQLAAESVLENESLTADLDDEAAQVLLDWGVSCAERAARETDGLEDAAAEEAMSPRLRAVRKLMRLVNRWAAQPPDPDAAALLDELLAQAATIYGASLVLPDEAARGDFVNIYLESGDAPAQRIAALRAWLERPPQTR